MVEIDITLVHATKGARLDFRINEYGMEVSMLMELLLPTVKPYPVQLQMEVGMSNILNLERCFRQ